MTPKKKSPIEEAADRWLATAPKLDNVNASLSASVPHGMVLLLKRLAIHLSDKDPKRIYTASDIASMVRMAYLKHDANDPDIPPILFNMRAFGRYLQSKGGEQTGFEIAGKVNNRRTYKPMSRDESSLDT